MKASPWIASRRPIGCSYPAAITASPRSSWICGLPGSAGASAMASEAEADHAAASATSPITRRACMALDNRLAGSARSSRARIGPGRRGGGAGQQTLAVEGDHLLERGAGRVAELVHEVLGQHGVCGARDAMRV